MLSRRNLLAGIPAMLGTSLRGSSFPKNVLFFAVDDLNNHVGTYGKPVKTPHIDALASRGVRFDRAYCQYPLCNPSRTSLLTGIRPQRTGVTDNVTFFRKTIPDVVTLPQLFFANGYYTATAGKVFHGTLPDYKGWVDADMPGPLPFNLADYAKFADRWEVAEPEEAQPDYMVASQTIKHLENRPQDKPFFIACGFSKPHAPFLAPKKYFDWYDPADIKLPVDFAGTPLGKGPAYRPNNELFVNREATVPLAHEAMRGYYACTSFMDAQLGRVLSTLDRLNLHDNTIVVLIADHGWHLGEKGMWAKQTLFEPSVRIPLVISAPGKTAGKGCARIVESLHVYPTLADLCGLKAPSALEGHSLRPLLENPTARWDAPAYTLQRRGQVIGSTVRSEKFRYTEWDEGRVLAELYDHQKDPSEVRNLATDKAHAGTVKKMRELLRAV